MLGGENMKNKIEYAMAATLAAAVVLSPTLLTVYTLGFFIDLVSVL